MMQFSSKILFLTVYMFLACNTWSRGSEDSDCDSSSSYTSLPHTLASSAPHHPGEEHTTESSPLVSSPHTLSLQGEVPPTDSSTSSSSLPHDALLVQAEEGASLAPSLEEQGLQEILDIVGLTRDTLEAQDIPYESLERIWEVERRPLTSTFRWVGVDALVRKALVWSVVHKHDTVVHAQASPLLGINPMELEHPPQAVYMDMDRSVGFVNEQTNLLQKSQKRCCNPVWIYGGSVPLTGEKPYRKMTAWDEVREGIGFVVFRGLHLGIYAFLGYDLATAIQEGGVNFSMLTNLYRGQDEAMINHILSVLQNSAGPYLATTAVALPFVWGGIKGIWASCQSGVLEREDQEELVRYLETAPQGKGKDVFRWILPFHPIDKGVNTLLRHARWDGSLATQDLIRIQGVFEGLALKRYGYTQIVGMHALAKMVYANHLKDYKRLNKQGDYSEQFQGRVLGEILMKARGLEILEQLAKTKERWQTREGFWDGTDRLWKSLYANYLLWTLGQNKSWVFGTTMLGWKTVKAVTLSLLFKTLIEALIEYTRCPHAFKNLHHGEIGPVNDRIQCFESGSVAKSYLS